MLKHTRAAVIALAIIIAVFATGFSLTPYQFGATHIRFHYVRARPTFAIVTAVFARPWDAHFTLPASTSLASILNQTYANWHLVVVGDGLNVSQVAAFHNTLRTLSFPSSKLTFYNMDFRLRESFVYNRSDVWAHAGTNAVNTGLRIAYNLSLASHVARIDDDDVWRHDHLQNLADAYHLHNATFAFSQALNFIPGPFPSPSFKTTIHPFPPQPCGMIHATSSWSKQLNVTYLHPQEQRVFPRHPEPCCTGGRCANGSVLPADADLWERIRGMVTDGLVHSVIVSKPDVFYTNHPQKKCLQEAITQNCTIQTKCTAVLDYLSMDVCKRVQAVNY